MIFRLQNVGMHYGTTEVLRGVTLSFDRGELVAVIGPNGAGKSTLLGIMSGMRRSFSGECWLDEKPLAQWPRKLFAQSVSVVPQLQTVEFPFSAEQVVLMGRMPFSDGMFESASDEAAVAHAMQITDTSQFRSRDFRTLSGGERQRVILASALAQSPRALLLDEPTTFLDLEHQVSLYRLLRNLCREGLFAISVTHDINLAAAYADRIIMLHDGAIVADGRPDEVIHSASIRAVFSTDVEIQHSQNGRPWIHYGS
ncbi:MAG: heme ABC transporter ATP-binding protein [Bryobacteraceae bacterium]